MKKLRITLILSLLMIFCGGCFWGMENNTLIRAEEAPPTTDNFVVAKSIEYFRHTNIAGLKGEITIMPNDDGATEYLLFFGNGGKALDGYTFVAKTVKRSSSLEKCVISIPDGIIAPASATELLVFSKISNALSADCYAIALDGENILDAKDKLFSFNVFTDIHIQNDEVDNKHANNYATALKEVIRLSPDSKGIFTIGDNTDKGLDEQYEALFNIEKKAFSEAKATLPIYYAIGNHDYNHGYMFDFNRDNFMAKFGYDNVYYKTTINDVNFYTLGCDELPSNGNWASLSVTQLDWLKSELKLNGDKPCFVFLHQPLENTVSGSLSDENASVQDWYGVEQNDELQNIIGAYPNLFFLSGHGHWEMGANKNLNYGGCKKANYLNCASVGYLWNDLDKETAGSEAFFVDVYQGGVMFRGREFQSGQWVGGANFYVPTSQKQSEKSGCNASLSTSMTALLALLLPALALRAVRQSPSTTKEK